jgi:hypothetical protein
MRMGLFQVSPSSTSQRVEGRDIENQPSAGDALVCDVIGPRSHLVVADIMWDTGTRSVQTLEVAEGKSRFGRLLHGARLGVYRSSHLPRDHAWFELRILVTHADRKKFASLRKADYPTIVQAAGGLDVQLELSTAGATGIAARRLVLGSADPRGNILAATFPIAAQMVPTLGYILTRVVPLAGSFRIRDGASSPS